MKTFPIQSQRGAAPHPTRIPWEIADLAYSVYSSKYGRSQSLERLAERGGFGPGEMDEFLPGWREKCDELARLRAENEALRRSLECCLYRVGQDANRFGNASVYGPLLAAILRSLGRSETADEYVFKLRKAGIS